MSQLAIVLIVIGVVCVVVSLANAKHPPAERGLLGIDRLLSDEQIAKQLRFRRPRVDAKLGMQFGAALISLGLSWQTLIYFYWF